MKDILKNKLPPLTVDFKRVVDNYKILTSCDFYLKEMR
jgi:hypothetical protein